MNAHRRWFIIHNPWTNPDTIKIAEIHYCVFIFMLSTRFSLLCRIGSKGSMFELLISKQNLLAFQRPWRRQKDRQYLNLIWRKSFALKIHKIKLNKIHFGSVLSVHFTLSFAKSQLILVIFILLWMNRTWNGNIDT